MLFAYCVKPTNYPCADEQEARNRRSQLSFASSCQHSIGSVFLARALFPGTANRGEATIYPMTGVYHEIVEAERLVFTSAALGKNGNPFSEVMNTVTFADHGGSTKLTIHARVARVTAEAAPFLAGMEQGWSQSLDRLADEVAL